MVKNLQANAISEHIHNTFGDIIQKLVRENLPNNIKNIIERVDKVITSEQHDLQSVQHITTGVAPRTMVFRRDMFLRIPVSNYFNTIYDHRQAVIDEKISVIISKRVLKMTILQMRYFLPHMIWSTRHFSIPLLNVNGTITIDGANSVLGKV